MRLLKTTHIDTSSAEDTANPDKNDHYVSRGVAQECDHPSSSLGRLFDARDYISNESFVVGYCRRCKLYVTSPTPSEQSIAKFYPAGYYGTGSTGKRFTPAVEMLLGILYDFRVRQISKDRKPGKVLDIGCGRGLLLDRLRKRGWDPVGTELSETSASYARDVLHLPVITKPFEEIGFKDGEFDLVILWHVLEHIHQPLPMLKEIGRILKPGGTLLVAVPNFGSWEAKMGRKGWFHLDVPRHLTHFTPRTLRRALNEVDMTISGTNFFSSEYDFYSFVQTVQNKMGLHHNLLYNLLRTRSAKVLEENGDVTNISTFEILISLLSAVPLALISLLYAPFVAAVGQGATMAVYAVKREDIREYKR
ncbi:MAG: class I SAM-dependent methyltransferase [Chloroflexota bacterium]|nr:class I SAM-dependent methyltransferase [Chloroflexota bacterium]